MANITSFFKKRRTTTETDPKPRPLWRRWLGRVFWLTIILFMVQTESLLPDKAFDLALGGFTVDGRFNWVTWEVGAVWDEIAWRLTGQPVVEDEATQIDQVLAFLERQRQINALNDQINQAYAQRNQANPQTPDPATTDVAQLEAELTALQVEQTARTSTVERILAAQVEAVLIAEGFGTDGRIWPPVTFRFTELPTYLIISPRDKIEVQRGIHMRPGMLPGERDHLEQAIEGTFDVSALVDNLGGIGSWPTMVIRTTSLVSVLDIIAHEWSHTYFLTYPLGQNYNTSRDMTTINETAASIIGETVARLTLQRYYPTLLPPPTPAPSPTPDPLQPTSTPLSVTPDPAPETYSQAMRRIRLEVDTLLAAGDIEAAEAYMEAERQKLVEMGYRLRRLNQAYFAFHGSYATNPASVDPIGPWMRQVYTQSGSLKDFVQIVAQFQTLDDLLSVVNE